MVTSPQGALRVLVVDDHPVVREGLRTMLSSDPGIEVIGEAGSGEEAIEKACQMEPDVLLTDIRMSGMSGIDVARRIKMVQPATAVILLTMYDSEMYVAEALRAGAAGYLVKDASCKLLCDAIHAVADGGTMVGSGLLRHAIHGLVQAPQQTGDRLACPGLTKRLTARELDVLRFVAQGYANKEIARELRLAEVTVKKHVQSIVGKLGVSGRTQAAIAAMRLGLVL